MTRFFDVSIGKVAQFERLLAESGLDGEMVDELLRKPELFNDLIADLKAKLAPPTPDLFRSPMTVFNAWAAQRKLDNWPFTDGQVNQLHERVEAIEASGFVSTASGVFSLDDWHGNLPDTFEAKVSWNQQVHGTTFWWYEGLKSGTGQLRLHKAVTRYSGEPFVRPVLVDLTANRGKAPRDVRSSVSSGFDLMTLFAAHDQYPSQIDYDRIPGSWAAAFEANLPGGDPWRRVPVLDWGRVVRRVGLSARWDGYASSHYAGPVSREL